MQATRVELMSCSNSYLSMLYCTCQHVPSSVCGGEHAYEGEDSKVVKGWKQVNGERQASEDQSPSSLGKVRVQVVCVTAITRELQQVNHIGLVTSMSHLPATIMMNRSFIQPGSLIPVGDGIY